MRLALADLERVFSPLLLGAKLMNRMEADYSLWLIDGANVVVGRLCLDGDCDNF
jgi:hypothetical protein